MEEGRIRSTAESLQKHFGSEPRMRVALEAGTHSPWVSRLLNSSGHEVIVANPRKIPTLTGSESKNDRNDAEQLARMAAFDPKLLHPIEHRSLERQQDLNLIHTRSVLVRARTMLVNSVRGLVKSAGGRLATCSSEAFPEKVCAAVPRPLQAACDPLLQAAEVRFSYDAPQAHGGHA
jgi:transposase